MSGTLALLTRPRLIAGLLAMLCLIMAATASQAQADASAALADVTTRINQAETALRQVDAQVDKAPDAKQQSLLRARADATGKSGTAIVAELEESIARVDARIRELGPRAPTGDAPEIARQRAALVAERAAIDAAARRGRLIAVGARQLVDELDRDRSEKLGETLSARVASPVTPAFWSAVLSAAPRDFKRIDLFLSQGAEQIRSHWRGGIPWQVPAAAIVTLLILFPLRGAASKLALRYLIEDARGHRIRRSANALQRIVVGTAAPALAAIVLVAGMHWAGLLPARWNGLLDASVGAAGFAGFVLAVTETLLMASQPSWRIAPLDQATVDRLQRLVWPLGLLSGASVLIIAFNASVGASAAAIVATQGVEAMLRLGLLVTGLVMLGRLRAAQEEAAEQDPDATTAPPGLSLIVLVSWIIAVCALVALLLGYVSLASFVLQIYSWAAVLGCATYLLVRAADDITTTILSRRSAFGRAVTRATGVRPSAIDQIGLIVAGGLRFFLFVVALGLLFTPFGSGGVGALFGRLGTLAQGIDVGGVSISPGTILRGVIVLMVGLAIVRAFMGWLEDRYLPATDLDKSSRDSVSLITRYVCVALAFIWALASLGVGVERIALLLSALSVGIGFGLQAITQNFISGLILLAERPIKIGDLIKVGSDEGDVKRISVRSTEIELGDHSTLIVPNSELITKSVLNKTRASPLGRVHVQFSVPLDVDVRKVRQIVLDAFDAEEAILDEPEPRVFLDSIADDRVAFSCFAHTSGPRSAYSTRSSVFLALLSRLHDEGIDISSPTARLERDAGCDATKSQPETDHS